MLMDYRSLADELLVKLLQVEDELAFKTLYLRYWRGLYNIALRKTNSREVAEDIVQSIFTSLWEKRKDITIDNISAYLNTAVKYQVINYLKTTLLHKTHSLHISERQHTEINNTEIQLLVHELTVALEKAIGQLPPKTQTIFRRSRYEKQTNREISQALQLSEKAVEYHISQSLKTLRLHLKDFIITLFFTLNLPVFF